MKKILSIAVALTLSFALAISASALSTVHDNYLINYDLSRGSHSASAYITATHQQHAASYYLSCDLAGEAIDIFGESVIVLSDSGATMGSDSVSASASGTTNSLIGYTYCSYSFMDWSDYLMA